MRFFFSLTILLAMAIFALASPYNTPGGVCEHGVDVHDKVSVDQFKCLLTKNYNYAIVRAERPDCKLDPYAAANIKAAWAAGFHEVDVYLFPNFVCGLSAHAQISSILTQLQRQNAVYGRVWLDVEASGSKWSLEPELNRKWLREAVSTIKTFVGSNDRIGIYTSRYGWSPVVAKWDELKGYKLWYANYDNSAHLNDTLNGGFGGWPQGTGFMKQYKGDVKECQVDVDVNVRRGANAACYNLGLFLNAGQQGRSLVEAEMVAEQQAESTEQAQAQAEAEAFTETETEADAEGEAEAEAEGEAEVEGEAEGEAEVEAEDELENEAASAEHDLDAQADLPQLSSMIEQANEAELEAVLLALEAEDASQRPILPAPKKEEKVVKGLTMVTYDQSKGSKGQNTVTNEIFTPKPVKCDPKKQHAHCDCKLDGPSPFVPVVA